MLQTQLRLVLREEEALLVLRVLLALRALLEHKVQVAQVVLQEVVVHLEPRVQVAQPHWQQAEQEELED